MAKLKVYATRIGFYDAIVAAPNQKAALAAWDVRENLFAQGAAAPTEDAQAVAAAQGYPGVVLRRPAGSDQPFSEAPATPDVPTIPRSARPKSKAKPARPEERPAPDRRALDAAERALAEMEAEARRRAEDIEGRRRDLDAEARELERTTATRRRSLEKSRADARRAYERQGGT